MPNPLQAAVRDLTEGLLAQTRELTSPENDANGYAWEMAARKFEEIAGAHRKVAETFRALQTGHKSLTNYEETRR